MKPDELWYGNHPASLLLAPLGWIYGAASVTRRLAYRLRLLPTYRAPCPVIVVGNLTVGGTGKTPLVIWLANLLREHGLRPGIVTRGYRGRATRWPQQVRPDSDPAMVGDEAVLLARGAHCPVAADPDRGRGAASLVEHAPCDVILSDDGLQHFALARDIEVAVLDSVRRHGNGRCLPAGPLREPVSRLRSVDLVVANGGGKPGEFEMRLEPLDAVSVRDRRNDRPLQSFLGGPVHAVCGIGNPQRYLDSLSRLGLELVPHVFPDHHAYRAADLEFGDERPVLMTEKDAIKCERFSRPWHWWVRVRTELPGAFGERLLSLLGARPEAA